ncbi:DUF192 domain-containing protein [Halonotius roseus]|uniref:DUF192 domain-containing protein n=1 Tax=Halonotius roseus TaxID=2511997 RepID=A0A544QSN9_9EURY|nr:DUF192 domain-containing protein [Halonotius roseus]TQQ82464.1 DUF192 domain-containing protein [Halonotius roseus]
MARPRTWILALIAVTVIVGGGALAITSGVFAGNYEWTPVTVVDDDTDAELATVDARIADTFEKRYTGLSNTSSLGPNEGMLFIHGTEGRHSYVMRDMAFPIDIVFIDADGEITTIHHAEPDDDGTFSGTGKYVLEVPYNYTTDNDIEVGDRVEIPAEYRS